MNPLNPLTRRLRCLVSGLSRAREEELDQLASRGALDPRCFAPQLIREFMRPAPGAPTETERLNALVRVTLPRRLRLAPCAVSCAALASPV
jgi:hypothetical protein